MINVDLIFLLLKIERGDKQQKQQKQQKQKKITIKK